MNTLEIVEVTNTLEIIGDTEPSFVDVADSTLINILSVGEQGPAGVAGSALLSRTAAASLSGHRAVIASSATEINYADKDAPGHEFLVLGIIGSAVSSGADTDVQSNGIMTEATWSWTPGAPIFLGNNGLLTQTPPSTGFALELGTAISATSIWIAVGQSVELA